VVGSIRARPAADPAESRIAAALDDRGLRSRLTSNVLAKMLG